MSDSTPDRSWRLGRSVLLGTAYRRGLAFVLVLYLVLYGGVLVWTNGLPFVMDNNESFSSFWHSYSLFHLGVGPSAGLTDETFSPHPEAHPFVHTHQGNFPRLFGFVLYALGLRTIESHIVATALTAGVFVVFLFYHVFHRLAGARFATVTTAVFLTDYVMYAQWHLVTYRVWHAFFLFASLSCVYGVLRSSNVRRWLLLTVLTYLGLFYYELVFVAFVSLFSALYALALGWRAYRRVILFGLAQTTGAAISLSILITQLALYLGWDGIKQDIYLTYVARNFGAGELRAQLEAFYEAHNIVFWRNVLDAAPYRPPAAMLNVLFTWQLQPLTPLLVSIVLVLVGGWVFGLVGLPTWLSARLPAPRSLSGLSRLLSYWLPAPGHTIGRGIMEARQGPFWLRGAVSAEVDARGLVDAAWWWLVRLAPLTLAAHFALVRITRDRSFLGIPQVTPATVSLRVSLFLLAVAFVSALVGVLLARSASRSDEVRRPDVWRVAVTSAFLIVVGLLVPLHPDRYALNFMSSIWWGEVQSKYSVLAMRGAFVAAVAAGAALALVGSRRLLAGGLIDVARLLACGLIAAVIVYLLATGYVVSGYLWRWAPIYVFVVDIAVGVAGTIALSLAVRALRAAFPFDGDSLWSALWALLRAGAQPPALPRSITISSARSTLLGQLQRVRPMSVIAAGVASFLLVFVVGYWLQLQRTYVALLPPTHYRALFGELASPRFAGATTVVNNYAAPTALLTRQWSYFDPGISSGVVRETPNGFEVERDMRSYLWLADAHVNPAYTRPEYYVCMSPQDLQTVVARLIQAEATYATRCADRGIVKLMDQGATFPLQHQIVARDMMADRWLVARLDWDFPPYLSPFSDGSRVRLRLDVRAGQTQALVDYQYAQQDGEAEGDSLVRLYAIVEGAEPRLLAEGRRGEALTLPDGHGSLVRASVTPKSTSKSGAEYVSEDVVAGEPR